MKRRSFLQVSLAAVAFFPVAAGCKSGKQFAHVLKPGEKQMVGSHQAGQETFKPLVDEAVMKLMSRHDVPVHMQVSAHQESLPPPRASVCFVGVCNRSAEEIGDFKEQIYQAIDSRLHECGSFAPISRQYVDAGLRELRLRPDDLFVPEKRRNFVAVMEQQGQPIQFLLFATLTSGTTRENQNYQRDYQLVLELVDIQTGQADKQTAELSKAYHQSRTGRWLSQ
jgi:peptidoglycan-synthase activator LpoB